MSVCDTIMPSSSNTESHSSSEKSGNRSQQDHRKALNAYEWCTTSIACFLKRRFRCIALLLVLAIVVSALRRWQTVPDGDEQDGLIDTPTDNIAEHVTVATQFDGAQKFVIGGNPIITNIGANTGVYNVNNYGGTLGLEELVDFVSFVAIQDSDKQDPGDRCHPGTRESILRQLRNWIDNPNPTDHIFWLYGPAGAGKSAIAQTIAHEYQQREVVATFFFYRSDRDRNDGRRLFTTIAWQIAISIPAARDFIVHELTRAPHLPTKNVEAQFEQLVARPFQAMDSSAIQMQYEAPVVIIDGVDECSSEELQRRFLTVIGKAVKNRRVPLRFLISSRPEPVIEDTLTDRFQDVTLHIDLATDSNHNIEKYLVDKFSDIASTEQGLDPTWPGQEIIEEIGFKSSGNFIFASTVIKFISDKDYGAESQLDIIRNLESPEKTRAFASLDKLYLEILERVPHQPFLKTFLALLVYRSSIWSEGIYEDDTILMNVSKKELHIKLRRMRSLLKFKPFIDVQSMSFLDFLHDSDRSGQYHVSIRGGQKRSLELIVDSIIRHFSAVIKQPDHSSIATCSSIPRFKSTVSHPPKIELPVEDWLEALRPLLNFQDRLLSISKTHRCQVGIIMRNLLLQLAILQRKSLGTASQPLDSNTNETVTGCSSTEPKHIIPENDLDGHLFVLFSRLQKTDLESVADAAIIDCMCPLLAFDNTETMRRIRSVSDAQNLIDFIYLLLNNESFLSQCGPDAAHKAGHLALEVFEMVPLLPRSLFLDTRTHHGGWPPKSSTISLESILNRALISRILDHNYIIPVLGIYVKENSVRIAIDEVNEQNESVDEWLKRLRPDFITRTRLMLEVAKTVRYIHSMDVELDFGALSRKNFVVDSNFRVKFLTTGPFDWRIHKPPIPGNEEAKKKSILPDFARLFDELCFGHYDENLPTRLAEDVRQLTKRCLARDPRSRLTMKDVVKEMETWDLSK